MSRVFISYAREDRPVVKALADGLRDAGHEVWWDEQLSAGDGFREVIEGQLAIADVVVVVWSKRASASRYVLDEAERAVSRGVLLPVCLDTAIPLGYGTFNTLDFQSWGGSYDSKSWRTLLSEVAKIARAPKPPPQRVRLQVAKQAVVVAMISGLAIGTAFWELYPSTEGHPILASMVLGLMVSAPVALLSAFETRSLGFEKLSLVAWRSVRWFLYGGCFALLVVPLAKAAGMIAPSSHGDLLELLRAWVTVGVCSATIVTTAKLCWRVGRRLLGQR